jgi:capsular exopolysaccharide family
MSFLNVFKRKKMKKNDEDASLHLITAIDNFGIKESYKAIRANINFAVPEEGCKKIMVCSAFASEGKSTTCVNLAMTVAETEAKVVVIDCDLRRSRVHKFFNLDNKLGLSNYLAGKCTFDELVRDSGVPFLKVISAGTIPPNPAELLTLAKMDELLAELAKDADYIFFDTPPVCVVSDALPLSAKCHGVILVVKHMITTHPNIRESLDKLKFAGANVVGIILNGIKLDKAYKSYGKYSKYSKNSAYSKYGETLNESESSSETGISEAETTSEKNTIDNIEND